MVAILGFSKNEITDAVRAMYADVAKDPRQYFHFPVGRSAAAALGYPESDLNGLPQSAVDRFAGVGNPFRADIIKPGDTVLDIGAGAGTDTLIASRMTGEKGKVWALDITPDMLATLRTTLHEAGITNVEIIEGDAERIPLPDNSVDVVTSNGALNLVPDKRKAFTEILRVLRPGGRAQIADIVIERPVPLGGRSDPKLWAECVVGASVEEDYLDLFRELGFTDVERLRTTDYFALSPSEDTRHIAGTLGARSIEITMRRPKENESVVPAASPFGRLRPRRMVREIAGRGLWGAMATIVALIACYGTLTLLGILGFLGLALTLNEGLWALIITLAALLAAVGTGINVPRHKQPWPLATAILGAVILTYTMFISYSVIVEALGFAVLVGAVGLDLYLVYRAECIGKPIRGKREAATSGPARSTSPPG